LKTAGSNTYFRSIRKLEFDSIWKFGFECLYRQEEDARTFDEFVNNLQEATSLKSINFIYFFVKE
jgi:hypothetical protein